MCLRGEGEREALRCTGETLLRATGETLRTGDKLSRSAGERLFLAGDNRWFPGERLLCFGDALALLFFSSAEKPPFLVASPLGSADLRSLGLRLILRLALRSDLRSLGLLTGGEASLSTTLLAERPSYSARPRLRLRLRLALRLGLRRR